MRQRPDPPTAPSPRRPAFPWQPLFLLPVVLALACQTLTGAVPTSTPPPPTFTAAPTASPIPVPTDTPAPTAAPEPTATAWPEYTDQGVRYCAYVPGVSRPAQMPPEVSNPPLPTPYPTATPPPSTAVEAEVTERQLRVFRTLWDQVDQTYVYLDFNGQDWAAIGARYEALIRQGLADEHFHAAMNTMVFELGDEHSHFQSPAEVAEEAAEQAGHRDSVGIGALIQFIGDDKRAVIIAVFPGSPAAEAGLRPHDAILQVDGGPVVDDSGAARTLGPEGTPVTVTVQRPGEPPRDLRLTRRRVTGATPVDYCLVPSTRIGYIFFPTFLDETVDDQARAAIEHLTADGPLDGLILDNRMNGGGSNSVARSLLSMFTGGVHGYFISRETREELLLEPEDVNGSQSVPLVILVDVGTVSYAEIFTGVLRVAGRAQVVGQATHGNVELLSGYDFEDGSRAWIAAFTFEPLGQASGVWERTGIVPDVSVPTRWDLFTEANDPALALAVELLQR